jgi:hypothetical protein
MVLGELSNLTNNKELSLQFHQAPCLGNASHTKPHDPKDGCSFGLFGLCRGRLSSNVVFMGLLSFLGEWSAGVGTHAQPPCTTTVHNHQSITEAPPNTNMTDPIKSNTHTWIRTYNILPPPIPFFLSLPPSLSHSLSLPPPPPPRAFPPLLQAAS